MGKWVKGLVVCIIALVIALIPVIAFATGTDTIQNTSNDIRSIIGTLLVALLVPVLGAVGTLLGKLLNTVISKEKNVMLQTLSWQAVNFVEQKFEQANNEDKYQKAYEFVASKLPGVNAYDIKVAVEAAVRNMKAQVPNSKGSSTV